MSLPRKMIHAVEVYRPAPVRSGTGTTTAPLPAEPLFACRGRLAPGRGAPLQGPDGLFYEADAVLYLSGGTDVRPRPDDPESTGQADRVRVKGATYRVLSAQDVGGAGKVLRCLLKREA